MQKNLFKFKLAYTRLALASLAAVTLSGCQGLLMMAFYPSDANLQAQICARNQAAKVVLSAPPPTGIRTDASDGPRIRPGWCASGKIQLRLRWIDEWVRISSYNVLCDGVQQSWLLVVVSGLTNDPRDTHRESIAYPSNATPAIRYRHEDDRTAFFSQKGLDAACHLDNIDKLTKVDTVDKRDKVNPK